MAESFFRGRRIAVRSFLPLAVGLAIAVPQVGSAVEQPIRVVTSIPPLAMLASQLGGDRAVVHSILPPGADPHTFELRPSDATSVAEADIVVMLGSEIDDWLAGAMDLAQHAIVVKLDAHESEPADHADGAHDAQGTHDADQARNAHDHTDDDPHVWLDPRWVRERAVPALQRALMAADAPSAALYGVSAREMAEDLADLEVEVSAKFVGTRTRSFLAWHPSWQRFAKRFRLHSVGSLGESEGREPSLRAMADAVRAARAAGVLAVLVEPQVDPRQARVLAEELSLPIVTVDPLGDAWSSDRATYRNLMLFNAHAFAKALGASEDSDRDESRNGETAEVDSDDADGEASSPNESPPRPAAP